MFELWDLFVRFRNYVWTGNGRRWRAYGSALYEATEQRGTSEPDEYRAMCKIQNCLFDVTQYLEANSKALIDYREWKKCGKRISTGYVESSINRLVGRRMAKGQQMRWSRGGAHAVLQVRAALQNGEFDALAKQQHPRIDARSVSWPWMKPSPPF